MSLRPSTLLAAAVLGTTLVGCGGSSDAEPAAPTARITIERFEYQGDLTVPAGTSVEVANLDHAPHTLSSVDNLFDTNVLNLDEAAVLTFDEPGSYPFLCTIHPSMTGTVTVTG